VMNTQRKSEAEWPKLPASVKRKMASWKLAPLWQSQAGRQQSRRSVPLRINKCQARRLTYTEAHGFVSKNPFFFRNWYRYDTPTRTMPVARNAPMR
jgi:hypothetical protein